MTAARRSFTSEGTHLGAFTPFDWALVAVMAVSWGSSFALIAEALESLSPAAITLGRVFFGAVIIGLHPAARVKIDRDDWPRVAALGVLWMAIPLTLYGYAEQRIDSSVAGMITGGTPLLTALIASLFLGRLPGRLQIAGLLVGFLGILAISAPELADSAASSLGAGLVVVAIACYGVATNLGVPAQQKYGSIPVLFRMQLVAMAVIAPLAIGTQAGSSIEARSVIALVPLGMAGTGFAFVAITTLSGRVGATRASIGPNLVPVVAATIGIVFRDEAVAGVAWLGVGFVIAGAWLVSRADAAAPAG